MKGDLVILALLPIKITLSASNSLSDVVGHAVEWIEYSMDESIANGDVSGVSSAVLIGGAVVVNGELLLPEESSFGAEPDDPAAVAVMRIWQRDAEESADE